MLNTDGTRVRFPIKPASAVVVVSVRAACSGSAPASTEGSWFPFGPSDSFERVGGVWVRFRWRGRAFALNSALESVAPLLKIFNVSIKIGGILGKMGGYSCSGLFGATLGADFCGFGGSGCALGGLLSGTTLSGSYDKRKCRLRL